MLHAPTCIVLICFNIIHRGYQELLERLNARRSACAVQCDAIKRSIVIIDDEERVSLMLVRARSNVCHPLACTCA